MPKRARLTVLYRIVEMAQWDEDFVDLVTKAYLKINADGSGRFQFGAVEGSMDCRSTVRDGKPAIDFSWEGFDDDNPVGGRGWAELDGDTLRGHLYFHIGDDQHRLVVGLLAVLRDSLRLSLLCGHVGKPLADSAEREGNDSTPRHKRIRFFSSAYNRCLPNGLWPVGLLKRGESLQCARLYL